MSEDTIPANDTRDAYVAEFGRLAANRRPPDSDWLRSVQTLAIEQFQSVGFPSARDERWRFTNLKPLVERRFGLGNGQRAGVSQADLNRHPLVGAIQQCMVFVNGRYDPELSSVAGLPEGVVTLMIPAAVQSGINVVERHFGRVALVEENPFTALNTAFFADGALLWVPEGVVLEEPVQLLYVTDATAAGTVMHPRTLVVVGQGSALTVAIGHVGLAETEYWSNAVTELVVGENACARLLHVQLDSDSAFHTSTTCSVQARDSAYSFTTVALGGALVRHDVTASLDGTGAECTLHGLTQVRGAQHIDHHTTIVHERPHCTSREHFNGIFDGRARGVFTGRVVVRKGAQQTDAKQTNRNLLLAETARADSQPQLEIHADDVKCTHGATVGPIDEKAMFYLRSRGLPADVARNMLTYGFGVEILRQITVPELRDRLDKLLHARLEEGSRGRQGAE